ncbi:hypothetical protein [Actinomadura sp. DC4]|uniref:hypothetical protein n=1 Tax=Actinomadura sp. DC4 TaxID=3055069 RepID=UPI0025AF8EF7|nr:hypothetical protein [Actinomadura sp. DC4]MDN3353792.1 hypothetical protein [Actinomadura sp. DC4]
MEAAPTETGSRAVRRVQLLLACTLGLTALYGLTAAITLSRGHATVAEARERGVPALLGALTAHSALSDADRAAWTSFRSGEAQLIGPGPKYQNDITTAGQNLERLAVLDTTGTRGRQLLQAVNGQLVTYQGLVEQADATYRQGTRQLGYTYLTYGSTLLHGPGGLLGQIDEIAALNRAELDRGRRSVWVAPGLSLVVVAAAAALLACLVWAQVHTARAFRRTLNPALLLASVLVAGLTGWDLDAVARGEHALRTAERRALPAAVLLWQSQIDRADAESRGLREGRSAARSGDRPAGTATGSAEARLDSLLATAADDRGLPLALPLAGLAIALLAGAGLGVRLAEFRG